MVQGTSDAEFLLLEEMERKKRKVKSRFGRQLHVRVLKNKKTCGSAKQDEKMRRDGYSKAGCGVWMKKTMVRRE